MRRRVGIIGTGWVGSSVAISILHSGTADELLLHDIRPELAEGEAMDLAHGASFYPSAQVRAASIEEMAEADAVVVAAGRGGRPGIGARRFTRMSRRPLLCTLAPRRHEAHGDLARDREFGRHRFS